MVITSVNVPRGGGRTDIRIREGERRDRDLIWRATTETLWGDVPEAERAALDRDEVEAHFRPHAEHVMDSQENAVFVAEDAEGRVLGYAVAGGATTMLTPAPFGFLYDLWVAPEARRRGVARRLAEHVAAWCRARGFRRMKLEVGAGNATARALYASLGFSEERVFMGKAL